jgi:HemY protein
MPAGVEKSSLLGTSFSHATALASAPGAPLSALADLGRLYEANGYDREARVCWIMLHRAEPKEARWTYYLALIAEHSSDDIEQASWLRETVKLAPKYTPAWLELGQLAFNAGRPGEAERAFSRRLALLPNDPHASLGLARLRLQQGKISEGRAILETIIQANPSFSSARNILAELMAKDGDATGAREQRWLGTVAGRFRAAEDPWEDELRPFCLNPDQFIVWGETDYLTKHGDLGRKALEKAVELAPANPRAQEMLARFYLDVGEPAKARSLLEQHLDLRHPSESLLAELSESYLALDDDARSLEIADRGLAQIPDSASLYNARGLALASLGKYEDAMAAYRAAIERAPSTSSAPANLGLLYLLLGRKDEARSQLVEALRAQPGYSKAVIALASLELETGHFEAAYQYISSFYDESPGSKPARDLVTRYSIAVALEATKRGDSAAAEKAYLNGIARVPESAELHGLLGLLYTRMQRFPEAISSLEAAHRLQPRDARVSRLLNQLYDRTGRAGEPHQ